MVFLRSNALTSTIPSCIGHLPALAELYVRRDFRKLQSHAQSSTDSLPPKQPHFSSSSEDNLLSGSVPPLGRGMTLRLACVNFCIGAPCLPRRFLANILKPHLPRNFSLNYLTGELPELWLNTDTLRALYAWKGSIPTIDLLFLEALRLMTHF